jgi:signal transduction histidine kinase
VVEPWLIAALTYTGVAIVCSLIFAAFLANLALKPIEQIGARLDALALAEAEVAGDASARSGDAVVLVSHKIERIGRRMRNVEEVFSALKENLDQIMTNLQDGILLYTHDARAVLVSDSVERFLGIGRAEILGSRLHEVFSRNTRLGRLVRESFDARMALVQEEITTETGRHVEISLDFIHDDRAVYPQESLGALLTLHDVESVREIESDLELSRRLAAIGRLTAGVGHEVKNPINAIVVHLELLRNKLGGSDNKAMRHLEVIESEIQRLDRVVQTLVDFSRPVELQLKEQDLRRVVSAVLMLSSADLETRDVHVQSDLPDHPVLAKVDADLLKQALLNVVLNGAQAMAEGGRLKVRLAEDGRMALLSIHDEGSGIPPEVRDKIFDLYFTTKKDGSGIGLAMTYRIVELHNGSIEVESDATHGTTFILRFPLNSLQDSRARGYLMPDGSSSAGSIVAKEPRG